MSDKYEVIYKDNIYLEDSMTEMIYEIHCEEKSCHRFIIDSMTGDNTIFSCQLQWLYPINTDNIRELAYGLLQLNDKVNSKLESNWKKLDEDYDELKLDEYINMLTKIYLKCKRLYIEEGEEDEENIYSYTLSMEIYDSSCPTIVAYHDWSLNDISDIKEFAEKLLLICNKVDSYMKEQKCQ